MSQRYGTNEPTTRGKVLIHTSVGDLDVELWPQEAPLACRNFVQLCMERYFEGVPIFRVVKNFMAQTGDPTGKGTGGESIFGKPFRDEFHSRLRFNRAGLVAMASDHKKRDSNGSQFFFSLGPCEWLNKQHTIFGKITGNTIYNLLKLNQIEIGENDRPLDPEPRILSTEVLSNPFDDIEPRKSRFAIQEELEKQMLEEQKEKIRKEAKKYRMDDSRLVSFGQDIEEEEEIGLQNLDQTLESQQKETSPSTDGRKRDRELGKVHNEERGKTAHSRKKSKRGDRDHEHESKRDTKASSQDRDTGYTRRRDDEESDKLSHRKRNSKKKHREGSSSRGSKREKYDKSSFESHGREEKARQEAEKKTSKPSEYERLKEQIIASQVSQPKETPKETSEKEVSALEQLRQKYVKANRKSKKQRQEETLLMLNDFSLKLDTANKEISEIQEPLKPSEEDRSQPVSISGEFKGGLGANRLEDDNIEDRDGKDWMRVQLKFRSHIDDSFRTEGDFADLSVIDSKTERGKDELKNLEVGSSVKNR